MFTRKSMIQYVAILLFSGNLSITTFGQVQCYGNYSFAPAKYLNKRKIHIDAGKPQDGEGGGYKSPEPQPVDANMPWISKKYKCFLIKLHILSGCTLENEEIDDALARTNQLYQKAGIQLRVDDIIIYKQPILEIKIDQTQRDKVLIDYKLFPIYEYINVYIVDQLKLDGNLAAGAAMFPDDNLDIIFIRADKLNDGLTLTHELGHFFGLFHTCETFGDKTAIGDDGLQSTSNDVYYWFEQYPDKLQKACETGFLELNGQRYYPPRDNIMSLYNCPNVAKRFLPEQLTYMRHIALHERKYLKTITTKTHENIHNIEWHQFERISIDYLVETEKKTILLLILDDKITWCRRLLIDLEENDAFVKYAKNELICIIVNSNTLKSLNETERAMLLGNRLFKNHQEGIKITIAQKCLDPNFVSYPTRIILQEGEGHQKANHFIMEGYQSPDDFLQLLKKNSSNPVISAR